MASRSSSSQLASVSFCAALFGSSFQITRALRPALMYAFSAAVLRWREAATKISTLIIVIGSPLSQALQVLTHPEQRRHSIAACRLRQ
jgi:hypothetical protein